jgi:hypothetical protein
VTAPGTESVPPAIPEPEGSDWIDELADEECMEIFWLYVESPDAFLRAHPPALLGQAMRYALREVLRSIGSG